MRPTESKLVRHREMTIVDSDSGANDHEASGPGVRAKDFILFILPILHHPVTIIITGLSTLIQILTDSKEPWSNSEGRNETESPESYVLCCAVGTAV